MNKLEALETLHKTVEIMQTFDVHISHMFSIHRADAKIVRKLQSIGLTIKASSRMAMCDSADIMYRDTQLGNLFSKGNLMDKKVNYFKQFEKYNEEA